MRSVNRYASVVATPVLGLHELAAAELACVFLSLRGVGRNRDLAAGDDHWASWGARVDRALSHEYLSLSDSGRLLGSLSLRLVANGLLAVTLGLGSYIAGEINQANRNRQQVMSVSTASHHRP